MSAKLLKRYEAVFLINHPKGPKLTNKVAAKYMRKFHSSRSGWNDIWRLETD